MLPNGVHLRPGMEFGIPLERCQFGGNPTLIGGGLVDILFADDRSVRPEA
jgi:hypothetical protein